MFNPNEYKNQHYVSEFWQRRFAGPDGNLYVQRNGKVGIGAAKDQMSGDWIYTTFDNTWHPSNQLERASGSLEKDAARAFRALDAPSALGTLEDQFIIRWFVAFSACRHPDTMSMGHRMAKEMAYLIADAHTMTPEQFCDAFERSYSAPRKAAAYFHSILIQGSPEHLLAQAEEVESLSPNDPRLNQQLAISPETILHMFGKLSNHYVTIIDAPPIPFILGDTPFAPALFSGFTLPISSEIALLWQPGSTDKLPDFTRRPALFAEVDTSNRTQADNALTITIGPSKAALERYI